MDTSTGGPRYLSWYSDSVSAGRTGDRIPPGEGEAGDFPQKVSRGTVSLTSRWMGWVVNATLRPLKPRKRDPVPIVEEAGWAPGPVWTGAENLTRTGFDSSIVQLVASRYTDWAIPVHNLKLHTCFSYSVVTIYGTRNAIYYVKTLCAFTLVQSVQQKSSGLKIRKRRHFTYVT